MAEDLDLELMRMRKMAQLQKRAAMKKASEEKPPQTTSPETAEEILQRIFVNRAWEVWNAAQNQYPTITQKLKQIIAQLVSQKKITQPITGEQLMGLFRGIGLNVRLNTKIRILESGEVKTIAQKMKE